MLALTPHAKCTWRLAHETMPTLVERTEARSTSLGAAAVATKLHAASQCLRKTPKNLASVPN